jgi:hypothetical protein
MAQQPRDLSGRSALRTGQILVQRLPADLKLPRELGLADAGSQPLPQRGNGLLGQRFLPALIRAPPLGQGNPFPLAFLNQGPLKLGKGTGSSRSRSVALGSPCSCG